MKESSQDAADRWLTSVLANRDLASVWSMSDEEWRKGRVSDFLLFEGEGVPALSPSERRETLARDLPALANDDGPKHPRWQAFQRSEIVLMRQQSREFRWSRKVARVIRADDGSEVVVFIPTKISDSAEVPYLALRMIPEGDDWKMAGTETLVAPNERP